MLRRRQGCAEVIHEFFHAFHTHLLSFYNMQGMEQKTGHDVTVLCSHCRKVGRMLAVLRSHSNFLQRAGGEMVQPIKSLHTRKTEFRSPELLEKPGRVAHVCNPSPEEEGMQEDPCWLVSLTETMSSRFNERLTQKAKVENGKRHSVSISEPCVRVHRRAYIHTSHSDATAKENVL